MGLGPAANRVPLCPPSYPYSEDSGQGGQYMNTRCPAWCDRVLMSPSARELILKVSAEPPQDQPHRGDPGQTRCPGLCDIRYLSGPKACTRGCQHFKNHYS